MDFWKGDKFCKTLRHHRKTPVLPEHSSFGQERELPPDSPPNVRPPSTGDSAGQQTGNRLHPGEPRVGRLTDDKPGRANRPRYCKTLSLYPHHTACRAMELLSCDTGSIPGIEQHLFTYFNVKLPGLLALVQHGPSHTVTVSKISKEGKGPVPPAVNARPFSSKTSCLRTAPLQPLHPVRLVVWSQTYPFHFWRRKSRVGKVDG